MFQIPVKDIIVNEDSQVVLLEDDGTAYADNDTTPTTGGVIFQGFLELTMATEFVLLAAATRIIATATSAAVAQVATLVITTTAVAADTVFRIVVDSMDLTGVEFQNRANEKRYQIPVQTTTDGIGAAIVSAINADANSLVTASYSSGSDTLTITAKNTGQTVAFYSDSIAGTWTVTVAASLGTGLYDNLKNINWAKNVDFDRNPEWFPRKGATYKQYYFRITKLAAGGGGEGDFPSLTKQSITTDYRLYVRTGLTLLTAMDLLVGDLNA